MAGADGLGVSGVPAAAAKWPPGKESEVTSSPLRSSNAGLFGAPPTSVWWDGVCSASAPRSSPCLVSPGRTALGTRSPTGQMSHWPEGSWVRVRAWSPCVQDCRVLRSYMPSPCSGRWYPGHWLQASLSFSSCSVFPLEAYLGPRNWVNLRLNLHLRPRSWSLNCVGQVPVQQMPQGSRQLSSRGHAIT